MNNGYDFRLTDQGTIVLLVALTDEAMAWVEQNISREGYQPELPKHTYMEPRYVDAILEGIDSEGLTIDVV